MVADVFGRIVADRHPVVILINFRIEVLVVIIIVVHGLTPPPAKFAGSPPGYTPNETSRTVVLVVGSFGVIK
ncbi:MAG: hypothetical protein GIX02_12005 [Candidatus Eremiobacteraeota bacterium]|nr:hypothetical protein [Candidatus Eremiobacteraeota bacterium]